MGKRNEWTAEQIAEALDVAQGHLATAASYMNKEWPDRSKVTRQNLQTWVNEGSDNDAKDVMDQLPEGTLPGLGGAGGRPGAPGGASGGSRSGGGGR